MRRPVPITLTETDQTTLQNWLRSRTLPVRQGERARIILGAAAGRADKDIARDLGCSRQRCARTRRRFQAGGVGALTLDAPRSGRPRHHNHGQIAALTTGTRPANATDWSTRLMADQCGASASTVRRAWHAHGLKPHLMRGFKLSRDPRFVEKLEDIVGLYLTPPEHALVLCCDEKSQIQALERTQPGLPLRQGRQRTQTHDYKRHGTTTLFAALNMLEGTVSGCCAPRHRHTHWLKFLRQVDAQTPEEKTLHLVIDNYCTHKHPKVLAWGERRNQTQQRRYERPRIVLHFTPTGASWLNMVERFFRDLTTRRLRGGILRSVEELVAAIENYLHLHNQAPKPFIWTAKASDILAKVTRARTANDKLQNQ
jgi:transposase